MNIQVRIDQLKALDLSNSLIKQQLKRDKFSQEEINNHLEMNTQNELDAFKVMKFIIDNESKYKNNKELAKAMSNNNLASEKTSYHILSLMKFVKAYHELMS